MWLQNHIVNRPMVRWEKHFVAMGQARPARYNVVFPVIGHQYSLVIPLTMFTEMLTS